MKSWAVRLGVDMSVEVKQITGDLLDWLYKQIGCRIVEAVKIPDVCILERDDLIVMVDEEGLLRDHPQTNMIASVLCGHVIVGDAVLMRVGETEDGDLDWMGLKSWNEASRVCLKAYDATMNAINEALKGAAGHEEG